MQPWPSPAGCQTLRTNDGVYLLYLCSMKKSYPSLQSFATEKLVPLNVTLFTAFIHCSQQLFGPFLLLKIMSNCYVWRQISFNNTFLLQQVMAHGTLSSFSFSLSCTRTSPSSCHFLLYLMIRYFLSKPDVDLLMSPVCFLWVCVRWRRTEGERESDRGRKN